MRLFLAAFFLAASTLGASSVPQGTPPPGGGGGSLTSGVSPISGCSPGQFLYNNSGVLGCQAGSGGISSPGTTVLGNIAAWNSSTGSALLDTGISLSSQAAGLFLATPSGSSGVPLFRAIAAADISGLSPTFATVTGTSSANLAITSAAGKSLYLGSGSTEWVIGSTGALYPSLDNTYALGQTGNRVSSGFFTSLGSSAVGVSSLYLQGASTGTDLVQSGNTSTTNRTITIPVGTANDTLAMLAATNAYTGPNSFAGAATTNAANTTTIMGGSTAPTNGANAGFLTVGGLFASAPTLSTGQGAIYLTAANGLVHSGYGSTNDGCLASRTGACVVAIPTGSSKATIVAANFSGYIYASGTVPTTTTGGCTTLGAATGGMMAGKFATTSACGSGTTIVLSGLTATPNGYVCDAHDETTPATFINQTNYSTSSVTFTTSAATGATDTIVYKCMGF